MDQECYEVSWHTFHDHLQLTLQNLLNSDCFADVTLVCEDKKQYKAHKLILSACSSMFKSIINDFSSNNSVIFLKGIKGQEMTSILHYIYLGKTTVQKDRIKEFIDVAKSLEIKEFDFDKEYSLPAIDDAIPLDLTTLKDNLEEVIGKPIQNEITEDSLFDGVGILDDPMTKSPAGRGMAASEVEENGVINPQEDTVVYDDSNSNQQEDGSVCALEEDNAHEGDGINSEMPISDVEENCKVNTSEDLKVNDDKISTKQENNIEGNDDFSDQINEYCADQTKSDGKKVLLNEHVAENNCYVKIEKIDNLQEALNIDEFSCPHCNAFYRFKASLQKHIESSHLLIRFHCDICQQAFKQVGGLNRHIKSVHEGQRHNCDLCDKDFSMQGALDSHKRVVHEGLRYLCNNCGKQFNQKISLENHRRTIHEGIKIKGKTYHCELCNQNFTQHTGLTRHNQSIHEGRRYQCDQCDKHYSLLHALKSHIKVVHEGEKLLCNICGKQFNQRNGLTDHKLAVHEGKRFSCNQCDKQDFKFQGNLKAHIRSAHSSFFLSN